jgi:hypothetical protein
VKGHPWFGAVQCASNIAVGFMLAFLLGLGADICSAQSVSPDQQQASVSEAASASEVKGFSIYEEFRGSAGSQAQFLILDSDLDYDFNSHVGAEIGVPVYFFHPDISDSSLSQQWENHLGDPYGDLRLTVEKPILTYASVITLSIPVSSPGIFSTGRAGVNWSNHFEHGFGKFAPFVNTGIGNGPLASYVLSQPFRLSQPYQTYGFIADLEGGTVFRFSPQWSVGASYYGLVPAGHQRVFGGAPASSALPAPAPDTSQLTHDNGLSAFVRLIPTQYLYAQIGYVHSVELSQNAATFTVGVDVLTLIRRGKLSP